MRILGIDPGYAIVGFGIVDYDASRFKTIDYGAVTTMAGDRFSLRLKTVFEDISQIMDSYKPDVVSMEKIYFQNNQKTAIDVAQARGVILLAAAQRGIDVYEYTPLEVKKAVTGYGQAVKKQVQEMTKRLLNLKEIPKPDDTADALAMTVCHAHTSISRLNKLR